MPVFSGEPVLGHLYSIQGVAQLTPQRKLICADSNNITGKTDSFFLSAFLIELEAYLSNPPIPLVKRGKTREEQNE
jgi:hypothetical protein